jgi:hypothetical protein
MQELYAESISMSRNKGESDDQSDSMPSDSGIVSDGHFSRYEVASDDVFYSRKKPKLN